MARTKQTFKTGTYQGVNRGVGAKAARARASQLGIGGKAIAARTLQGAQHGIGGKAIKKRNTPKNYYNVQVGESTLSGGGGCLANALQTYYVSFFMKQEFMYACEGNISDCIRIL